MIELKRTTLIIGCLLSVLLTACRSDPAPSGATASGEEKDHEAITLTDQEASDLGIILG